MGFMIGDIEVLRPPPPGYVVDLEHPQRQQWLEHYLVFAIGAPLAFLFLCQRYYTKIFLSKGLQIDDFFMFIGWALSIVTQALLTKSIADGGLCVHSWEMPLERFERYSVMTYIAAPVYQLCNGFCKLSLLTIYLQLSPQRWFRVTTWVSIIIVILYTTIITAIMFFHCNPIRKAFDFKIAEGSCMDAGVLYMATAVSNIITDVILFILPTPMVWRLEMSRAQRIGAIVIFAIGSMTIATSVVRLVYLPATLKSTDPSWDAAPADVWTFVEGNLFVICGSMPTIRRFTRHLFPSVFATPAASPNTSNNITTISDSKRSNRKQRKKYELFTEDNELSTLRTMEDAHVLHKDADCDTYSESYWDSRKTTPRHD